MKNKIALAAFVPLAVLWLIAMPALVIEPGCAHVSAIASDVKACAAQEGDPVLRDLKGGAEQAVLDIFECDPSLDPAELAPCAVAGLRNLAAGLGPDGEAFVQCVVAKIESDPNALAKHRAVAKLARETLFRRAGWSRK